MRRSEKSHVEQPGRRCVVSEVWATSIKWPKIMEVHEFAPIVCLYYIIPTSTHCCTSLIRNCALRRKKKFKAPFSNILKKSSLNQMALCDVKGLQVLLIPLRINTQSAPLCSFLLGVLVCWSICLWEGYHVVCYRSLRYFLSRWQNKLGLKCEQTAGLPSTGDKRTPKEDAHVALLLLDM